MGRDNNTDKGSLSEKALTFLTSFVPVLLVALLLSASFLPITSFIDSATMFMLADRQEMYG